MNARNLRVREELLSYFDALRSDRLGLYLLRVSPIVVE
jgi:hypothetical protein